MLTQKWKASTNWEDCLVAVLCIAFQSLRQMLVIECGNSFPQIKVFHFQVNLVQRQRSIWGQNLPESLNHKGGRDLKDLLIQSDVQCWSHRCSVSYPWQL